MNEVDIELARSRAFIHALVDVRCELWKRHRSYRPVTKAFPIAPEGIPPQLNYLWRSKEEFEARPGLRLREAIRLHEDRTWSFQPTRGVGGRIAETVVATRTYTTIHGVNYGFGDWCLTQPKHWPC